MTPDEHAAKAIELLAHSENDIAYEVQANTIAQAQVHATLAARPDAVLRAAVNLIGTDCSNYTGLTTCVENGRSPYARYTAERWCNECIARTALAGIPFPHAA